LKIKTPNASTLVRDLSGGNQQKVVIGKWLTRDLNVLILDEPSRGVDVGARGEIHIIIRELAKQGVGVIVISSEVEELPGLCDRVLVMSEGRIVGEIQRDEISKESIIQLSYIHSMNN
jgi:ABC-type sugar transport system ATPase subunit